MEIIEKAKALGATAVDKLNEKREAVSELIHEKREALTETVGDLVQRGKDAAHQVVDKVASVVERGEPNEAAKPAPMQARVAKQHRTKKPRAERRRARRAARTHA
jgi:hypothetical protein